MTTFREITPEIKLIIPLIFVAAVTIAAAPPALLAQVAKVITLPIIELLNQPVTAFLIKLAPLTTASKSFDSASVIKLLKVVAIVCPN